jgi:hypothetical protein
MSDRATKILIYRDQNVANTVRQAGITASSAKIRAALAASEIRTHDKALTKDDRLETTDSGGNVNDVWLTVDGGGIKIHLIDAFIDITMLNKIVETALINRSGKVKERIQQDDYAVTIKGTLRTDASGCFPVDDLGDMKKILEQANSITISSRYCEIFDISKVVLKNATFSQSAMRSFNVMPFTLVFNSDMEYDFLVSE